MRLLERRKEVGRRCLWVLGPEMNRYAARKGDESA
jgi:hypothetical protein